MPDITAIKHPFISHLGRTQAERLSQALDPSTIQIDGRSRIDIIDLIYRLSRQVNFYDEQLNIGDWRPFFEDSLPFLLARIHKIDTDELEDGFHEIAQLVQDQPLKNNLRLLFDYLFTEVIQPINTAMIRFNELENSFGLLINSLVGGNLQGPMEDYIALYNAANHWFCIGKRSFFEFQEQEAWKLDFRDLFAKDESFRKVPGGFAARIKNLIDRLEEILQQFLGILKQLGQQAPSYLEESLRPLQEKYQEKHHPQLGLFFSFLELFTLFQQQLNQLSEAQLNFFFLKVLQVQQRATVPDKAHLVFEIQKQLDHFLLEKGTRFKDGKDLNNKDIFYQLDSEILIDKTQVTTLRTLFLKHVQGNVPGMASTRFVEGIYIAPDATKSDGIDQDFPAEGPNSWPTLGNKYSKYIEPATPPSLEPKAYPVGRTGLVLASPVLLLNEGYREVKIILKCKLEPPTCEREQFEQDFEGLFSGKKLDTWIVENWYVIDQETIDALFEDTTGEGQIRNSYELLIDNILDIIGGGTGESGEIIDIIQELILALFGEEETGEGFELFPVFEHEFGEEDLRMAFWPQWRVIFECLLKGCDGIYKYKEENDTEKHPVLDLLIRSLKHILKLDIIGYLLNWEDGISGSAKMMIESLIEDFVQEHFIDFIERTDSKHLTYYRPRKSITGEDQEPLFLAAFSGLEDWVIPEAGNIEVALRPEIVGSDYLLEVQICVNITPDQPAITFFEEKPLLECFSTELPLVRLTLNPDCKISCAQEVPGTEGVCQLENCPDGEPLTIYLYQFLRYLVVEDTCIEVRVCGLRNFVVQNDENVQDVNDLIFPFGVRPSIEDNLVVSSHGDPDLRGSNFYIGSKEVFCKNWEKVWVNLNWKDKPASLEEHYFGYEDVSQGIPKIYDEDFKIQLSILEDRGWIKEQQGVLNPYTDPVFFRGTQDPVPSKHLRYRPLFSTSRNYLGYCLPHYRNRFDQSLQVDKSLFIGSQRNSKVLDQTPLDELKVDTVGGFLRLTLKCRDFQHQRYPFVLARQMMAFGKFPDDFIFGAVYSYINPNTEQRIPVVTAEEFNDKIAREEISIFRTFEQIDRIFEFTDVAKIQTECIIGAIKDALQAQKIVDLTEAVSNSIEELIGENLSNVIDFNSLQEALSVSLESLIGATGVDEIEQVVRRVILEQLVISVPSDSSVIRVAADRIIEAFLSVLRAAIGRNDNVLRQRLLESCQEFFFNLVQTDTGGALEGLSEDLVDSVNDIVPVDQAVRDSVVSAVSGMLENWINNEIAIDLGEKVDEIIELFIEAFDPTDTDNLFGGQLLDETNDDSLIGILKNFCQEVQAETGFDDQFEGIIVSLVAEIETTLSSILTGSVIEEVKAFIDTSLFSTDGSLPDSSEIYERVELAILECFGVSGTETGILGRIKILQITESIENKACGVIEENTDGSCTVDIGPGSLFQDILSGFTSPIPFSSIEKLRDALVEYCDKLKDALTIGTGGFSDSGGPVAAFVDFIESLDSSSQKPGEGETGEEVSEIDREFNPEKLGALIQFLGLEDLICGLNVFVEYKKAQNQKLKDSSVVIPNEPYTPVIKDIALDYIATAQKEEIELFHLYPFDKSFKEETWETEEGVARTVTLLPTFEEEGTLFIGLSGLVPGNTVNLLFQLAEATADSEIPKARVQWAYLRNNEWVPLKDLFQIIEDNTNGLTRSGIIKIAIPGDITNDENNTLMPAGSYWIKAFAQSNTAAVCETINIHTQAALITYIDTPGLERESMQLAAGKITKLASADARVKKIEQPYQSFGGQPAEVSNRFFLRVSEQLRHKGRAIALCDYEQLVLDQFPEIFLAKCITHTMGLPASRYQRDLAVAPGFVGIAVVPDLNQLQVGDRLVPKAPVSLLDEIKTFLKRKVSPFVRLKVMNPRYEKVNVFIKVILHKDRTNAAYYEHKLEEDIRNFLAPWNLGEFERLRFGQKLNRSDFIRFVERLEYVDYICSFSFSVDDPCKETGEPQNPETLEPKTSRSILTAGDINAKVVDRKCEEYDFVIETPPGTCVERDEEQDLFPVCCDQ